MDASQLDDMLPPIIIEDCSIFPKGAVVNPATDDDTGSGPGSGVTGVDVISPVLLDTSTAGIHTVEITASDYAGNTTAETITYIVYDPSAGFVTGGGWIDSPADAYIADPDLTGKATFGFVSKYVKAKSVPIGNTEFQFTAGDLSFHSTEYQWLVVTGSNYARVKGNGTINGVGDYKFMLWAGDGDPDTFRIRIWEEDEFGVETDIYDNGSDQAIERGSIVIHKGKNK